MITRAKNLKFSTFLSRGVDHEIDLTIVFSGYSDPGRTYGLPENCYPPESEVEFHTVAVDGDEPIDFDAWSEKIGLTNDERNRLEEFAYEAMHEQADVPRD